MRMLRFSLAVVAALLAGAPPAAAEELLPSGSPVEEAIDHYIDATLQQEGVKPAPPADDANLLRRLMLDLVGRIPTAVEAKTYLESADPDKRIKLVDRLLASAG